LLQFELKKKRLRLCERERTRRLSLHRLSSLKCTLEMALAWSMLREKFPSFSAGEMLLAAPEIVDSSWGKRKDKGDPSRKVTKSVDWWHLSAEAGTKRLFFQWKDNSWKTLLMTTVCWRRSVSRYKNQFSSVMLIPYSFNTKLVKVKYEYTVEIEF
jgi:hypothetical protein